MIATSNVVVNLNGERHTLGSQFLNSLCLVCRGLFRINAHVRIVGILQSEFVTHQLRIVNTFAVYSNRVAGIGKVLTRQRINGVNTCQVRSQVQTVVPAQAEGLVGNGSVPVGILGAVFVVLVKHEVDLPGILGGTCLGQVVMELMRAAVVDHGKRGLSQRCMIQIAILEQGVCNILRLKHFDGHCLKTFHIVCVPVVGIGSQNLLVLVKERSHCVRAGVPHVLPGDCLVSLNTYFLNQLGRKRIQAVVGSNRGEVAQRIRAGVDDGLIVGSSDANHFLEHGSIEAGGINVFAELIWNGNTIIHNALVGLRHVLRIFVVFRSTGDHFYWHGGIGGTILGEVQYPFQTGNPVLSHHVSLLVAVFVDPLHAVIQHEGPCLATVFRVPFLCGIAYQCAMRIIGQQSVNQVDKNI